MNFLKEQINAWGFFWGVVYAIVALGFYFTAPMVLLLGLASVSTAVALQKILLQGFRWHFALLGAELIFLTIVLYLKKKGVNKLTIADIKPYRFFIGTMIVVFAVTYVFLFWLTLIMLRT